jgi:hypothetical protein
MENAKFFTGIGSIMKIAKFAKIIKVAIKSPV